jgi:predicted DCC family thiol-disulfide oxidoreductase YuxK
MQRILLRLPLLYLAAAVTLWISWAFALLWLLLFSPLVHPPGDVIYRWVARNRSRLPGSTCPPGTGEQR